MVYAFDINGESITTMGHGILSHRADTGCAEDVAGWDGRIAAGWLVLFSIIALGILAEFYLLCPFAFLEYRLVF